MHDADTWTPLHRCDDLAEADRITTSILAMGFEVRVRDLGGGGDVVSGDSDDGAAGPFVIETPADQHADLAAALPEIIDEQEVFDAVLAERDEKRDRQGRLLLWLIMAVAAASVVAVLLAATRRASGATPMQERALDNALRSVYLSHHA